MLPLRNAAASRDGGVMILAEALPRVLVACNGLQILRSVAASALGEEEVLPEAEALPRVPVACNGLQILSSLAASALGEEEEVSPESEALPRVPVAFNGLQILSNLAASALGEEVEALPLGTVAHNNLQLLFTGIDGKSFSFVCSLSISCAITVLITTVQPCLSVRLFFLVLVLQMENIC